jgi:recombination protein RecA
MTAEKKPKSHATDLSLEEVLAQIEKKNPGLIVKASQLVLPRYLTTGSLSFDIAFGGGLAVGKHHEIIGEYSHGKTVFANQVVAAQQELDPDFEVLWIAAEPYNHEWAAKNGMDNDRIHVLESNVMEEVYESLRLFMRNRAVDLVVLDSLPALVNTEEEQKTMDQAVMAIGARMNNRFYNRVSQHEMRRKSTDPDDRPLTMLTINQWRDKIGVMFGDPRTTPGGKGKDFAFWTRTEVRRREWRKDGKRPVGIEMVIKTHKNKSAPVGAGAATDFYFADSPGHPAGRYDRAKDLFVSAVYLGVISAGGYPKFQGELLAKTKDEAQAVIREDMELQRRIYAETLAVASKGGHAVVMADDDDED